MTILLYIYYVNVCFLEVCKGIFTYACLGGKNRFVLRSLGYVGVHILTCTHKQNKNTHIKSSEYDIQINTICTYTEILNT